MKQKFTEKKSANRGPSKTMHNAWYSMSVAERRRRGLHAFDSKEYDEKHGIATSTPSESKRRRSITRRAQ